ncbi:MAG TPA: endonuclease III [Fibrobacteres bacterium]|jgi:endonuclease-3|nr:endonuclease III [Fibrobacterota bacterium]
MTQKEKAKRIGAILDKLYPKPPIPLRHENPFTLCVAVLLSAQATDKSVNLVTPELFRRAATPEALAKLTPREIESIIKTVGLAPTKSRNLHKLARLLLERHGGKVPNNMEELEALPGVGHKTASVVMVQAFGKPAFPVDTHIHRLAERWGLSNGKNVEQTEKDLKALFPSEEWGRRHLQLIYYGREYCPARGHDPQKCPVCSKYRVKSKMVEKPSKKRV